MNKWIALAALLGTATAAAQPRPAWTGAVPEVTGKYGLTPGKFTEYKVVLGPDKDEAEWWAGGPSVARDAKGVFWMAVRMRTADAPYGLRGYEIRILRSADGVTFEAVHRIKREEVPIPGFERSALLVDPKTGLFKLYACGPWQGGAWVVFKFADVGDPREFKASTAKVVIAPRAKALPRDAVVEGYKDPVIIHAEGAYHAYLIGQHRGLERVYHYRSEDGEAWWPVGSHYESIMKLDGWHDFFVRPASVVKLPVGYLFVYEGSNVKWYDPVYNIATGLAFTFDLHAVVDLTPESPLLVSTTPGPLYRTWRYSHWMMVDGEMWVYAEVTKPNGANEVRLFRLKQAD